MHQVVKYVGKPFTVQSDYGIYRLAEIVPRNFSGGTTGHRHMTVQWKLSEKKKRLWLTGGVSRKLSALCTATYLQKKELACVRDEVFLFSFDVVLRVQGTDVVQR